MTFSDLRALHAIIGAAIDDIERIYRPAPANRRASQSSVSSTSFPARSPSKPRSSLSADSDADADEQDVPELPPTPVSASGPNSVRFAAPARRGLKGRERSHTVGALPQPPFSPPTNAAVPPPILKQPPLDFPDLDVPIALACASAPEPSTSTSSASASPQIPTSPTFILDSDNGAGGSPTMQDPGLRQREWRKKCEDLTAHPEVIKAVNRIVAACGQMSAMVQKPFLTVCDAAMGYNLPACLRFLEAAHIVEMLREAGPRGLSSKEIAEKIDSQLGIAGAGSETTKTLDPSRISHVLRLLATHHITREVRPDVFANNRVSSIIDSGKSWQELVDMKQSPESKYEGTDGIAAFVGLCTDELFKASAYLADCYLCPPCAPTPSSSRTHPVPPPAPRSPQSPVVETQPTIPPRPRVSVSAPTGKHLGMVTPNDSTSSLGSVLGDAPRDSEPGDSPMRFAQNPHPTPTRNRDRTKSAGWVAASSGDTPRGQGTPPTPRGQVTPPTPQSLPNAPKRPGILKRLSSRTFSRTPTPTMAPEEVPPLPPMPGTPRSATYEAPETPRSRVNSTTSYPGQRPILVPDSPSTPRSPSTSHPGDAPAFSDLLKTPRSAPRHAKTPSQSTDPHALSTPRSTPHRQSFHSSTPHRQSFHSETGARTTPRWTPSKESLRSLAQKGSFASLRAPRRAAPAPAVSEPHPQTYAELLDAAGAGSELLDVGTGNAGNGLLGPAFDLRPPGLAAAASPRARTFPGTVASPLGRRDDALPPLPLLCSPPPPQLPPPVPPKSPLRSLGETSPPPGHSAGQREGKCKDVERGGRGEGRRGLRPGDEMFAPFNVAFGTRMRYFEWLERGENVFRLRRFGKAMTGTEKWEVPGSIIGGFPWHELPPRAVVVDVGGGIGSTSMLLANAFPHLRFVIQDRPPVVEMGAAAWRSRYPELLDSGRATFAAHDFFKPQPPLPPEVVSGSHSESEASGTEDGAEAAVQEVKDVKPAVFLMRVITHDWPDSYGTRILLRLRQAAGPNTRLLLADYVLPLACVDEDEDIEPETPNSVGSSEKITHEPLPGTVRTLAPEGSPLLPNLGKANANAYWLDLTMRVMFNAQERTLRELAALARSAGWKIVQVTRAEGSLFGHLVAVPVEIPPETLALPEEGASDESAGHDDDTQPQPARPPMGDTFLSSVELPSEHAIRAGVASSSGRRRAGEAKAGGRRRARAYTFTGRDSRERGAPEGAGQGQGRDARGGGGEVRRGLRTIMRMLSRAHLRGEDVEVAQQEEEEEVLGPLALARQRTRT
ncbi:hypothetical protein PsYK624_101670 [Phanerochaete sordida]|uniref:O-methyltransferase C-terminal domain-containing protein n=1 Tax=Phanerochaete sordida TaxID=48140 RepID=A0A9P3LGU5_9APHY|nr:hypothetical protein PsYK624_101670 [Phanerochaete sordida]